MVLFGVGFLSEVFDFLNKDLSTDEADEGWDGMRGFWLEVVDWESRDERGLCPDIAEGWRRIDLGVEFGILVGFWRFWRYGNGFNGFGEGSSRV